jgi:hypothetical protein
MNISDEQLDRLIEATKIAHAKTSGKLLCAKAIGAVNWSVLEQPEQDAAALLHILETYRDMPKTADGVRVKQGGIIWDRYNMHVGPCDVRGPFGCGPLGLRFEVEQGYSTREAAESAKASGR